MKKLTFFSSLLIVAMLFLGSCSKSDTPVPGSVQVTFPITYDIVAAAGSTTSTSAALDLTTILQPSGNQNNVKNVSGSVLSNSSSIAFSGITGTGASLNNITFDDGISVKNVVLNDTYSKQALVITKDTVLSMGDNNYFNLLGQIGTDLASKKSISLKATYTVSGQSVTSGKITFNVITTFGWN